jgi:Excalibur calcium-binding domain
MMGSWACVKTIPGAVAAAGLAGALLASSATARDANCSDFQSEAAAQTYFLSHGEPSQDPAGLDSDGDGLACESNPRPYRGLLSLTYKYGAFSGAR